MIPKDTIPKEQNMDYFEQVPIWRSVGKCFEVMADERRGRIPVTRLESWREYAELLESPFLNRPAVQLIFRGQRRSDWSLMPKRSDAQARMRNVISVTQRKKGYPLRLRDEVVEKIMDVVKQQAAEGK